MTLATSQRQAREEVERMEDIKKSEKVEWTTQELYADGEIEFVELCFHIPAEL